MLLMLCGPVQNLLLDEYMENVWVVVLALLLLLIMPLLLESAEIKLSELAIGIGPFVVGPAVERKIGLSAFSQLAIDATMWRNADWARRKGLFAEVHPDIEGMDESIHRLADTLMHSSPASDGGNEKDILERNRTLG